MICSCLHSLIADCCVTCVRFRYTTLTPLCGYQGCTLGLVAEPALSLAPSTRSVTKQVCCAALLVCLYVCLFYPLTCTQPACCYLQHCFRHATPIKQRKQTVRPRPRGGSTAKVDNNLSVGQNGTRCAQPSINNSPITPIVPMYTCGAVHHATVPHVCRYVWVAIRRYRDTL